MMLSFNGIEESLKRICDECSYIKTDKCNSIKCNVKFSKTLIDFAKANSVIRLKDGGKSIPRDDFKYYREELIADSIGEISKLCKECRENHSEQCIISLCRHSLEGLVLREDIFYPGNILMYIMEVAKQNQNFAELIKTAYVRK